MENLHILLLRLGRSWADASMNQTHALCEAPWNLIPFLRRHSKTLHLKVQQRLRLPPTLQEGHRNWGLEEHQPPWPSALQGRVRSAMRGTASSGAVTGKREPRLNGTKWQSASSPGRRGFRRDPAVRPVKLREEAHTQGQQKSRTGPCPCRGFGRFADALTVGPKTLHPRQPLEFPTPKGDKGAKEKLPGAGARSARPPQLRTWESRGAVARRGANPPPPNSGTGSTLTGVEPPERRGAGGRFLWGPARVQSNPNFSRPLSPAAAGARAQTKSAAWPPRRHCPFGPLGGRELRPCGLPARAGPHFPSVCGLPAAATAPAKANAAATRAAATTTARPGTRRGLMLSSAEPPPLWASRASEILHIRGPAPSPAPY